jgi:hypothetical protein
MRGAYFAGPATEDAARAGLLDGARDEPFLSVYGASSVGISTLRESVAWSG